MSAWKKRFVVLTIIFLGVSFLIFLVTGYSALYWAWTRADLETARPYLPWARNFGMLAMAGAAVVLGILFSSKTFPVSPKPRLLLSLLATMTIGFFSKFRNKGKFYFKKLHHFFQPGTWIHELGGDGERPEADSQWNALRTMAKVLGVTTSYLIILATMFSLLEPQGVGWTLATAGTGLAVGTAAFLLIISKK